MTGCRRDCLHRIGVEAYRAARLAAEMNQPDYPATWRTELAERPPIVTFRDWLKQSRTDDRDEHAA